MIGPETRSSPSMIRRSLISSFMGSVSFAFPCFYSAFEQNFVVFGFNFRVGMHSLFATCGAGDGN